MNSRDGGSMLPCSGRERAAQFPGINNLVPGHATLNNIPHSPCFRVTSHGGVFKGSFAEGAKSYAKHRGPVFRAFSVHRQVRHI